MRPVTRHRGAPRGRPAKLSSMRTNVIALLGGLLLATTPAVAGDWSNDLDAAMAKAAKDKKPVVVELAADW